jgi:hypothetical protein
VAIVPAPVVPAPEPRGLRYGLLTAANGPIDLPNPHGLGGGVKYEPVSCGFARVVPSDCAPIDKTFDPADEVVEQESFLVYATLECGSVGHTAAEIEAKVRRRLANGEQTAAEEGFADVLTAGVDAALVAPDPTDIESVVGALEQWLYGSNPGQQKYGNVGFLHSPVRFAPYLGCRGLLIKDGLVWRTHMGTVMVFGGGYPDDGTIYISGQVTVWRAADVHVPSIEQTFNRTSNQWTALAEREYAVAYDCVAARVNFAPEVDPS